MLKAIAGLLLACAAAGVFAQYPERALRLVVPQAPGSATDTVARILAPEMSKVLGQPVLVENRPGGALTIGIDAVAKSAPDGYTIGMGPIGALAITRHMVAKLPYDIERDLQPVALVSRGHLLLAVAPSFPARSLRELIEYAQKNPGKLTNASSSNGSPGHVAGELFKYLTRTDIVHVPYKGGAMAINDLIAGHVQVIFESLNSIAPHARSGKVKALAGIPGAADRGGGGRARLRGRHLDRHHRARRIATGGARETELGSQRWDTSADLRRPIRADRRRTCGRHAGGFRRDHPPRFGALGRGHQAVGR